MVGRGKVGRVGGWIHRRAHVQIRAGSERERQRKRGATAAQGEERKEGGRARGNEAAGGDLAHWLASMSSAYDTPPVSISVDVLGGAPPREGSALPRNADSARRYGAR